MSNTKLGFDEAFDTIFKKVLQDIKSNSGAAIAANIPSFGQVKEALEISGSFDVYERLDENGKFHFERSEYAPKMAIRLTVTILSPDDTYTAELSSTGGGGGEWEDVHINEQLSTTIKTKLVSSTTVEVNLHAATARNVEFRAHVDYTISI